MRAGGQLLVLLVAATCSLALDQKDLDNALQGLHKVTNFFRNEVASLNPDALFGLRIGQGQLDVVVQLARQRVLHLPKTIFEEIVRIDDGVNETASLSYSSMQLNEGSYFRDFKPIVTRPLPAFFTQKHVTIRSGEAPDQTWKEYDEKRGDSCYSEVLDTSDDASRKNKHCEISDSCWDFMSRPKKHGYALTHQMLYFMLGRVFCGPQVNSRLAPLTIDEIFRSKCQQIYEDSASLSQGDYVRQDDRDLFIEQNLLCGVTGFDEFLTSRRLDLILSWQDESIGCFPKVNWIDRVTFNEYTRRKKRNDVVMENGCRGHISGLAAGILGAYVRKAAVDVYQI